MTNKRITLKTDVPNNSYRLSYRCVNCGIIFEFDMQVGKPTSFMRGECPHCKAKSGATGIGIFKPILFNPDEDVNNLYR